MHLRSLLTLIFALGPLLLNPQAGHAQEAAPCDCALPLRELLPQMGCELKLSLTQSQLFLPFETRVTFELSEPHAIPVRMLVSLQTRDADLMKRVVRVATRSMTIQPESVVTADGIKLLVNDFAFTGIEVSGKHLGSRTLQELNAALGFFAVECSPRN